MNLIESIILGIIQGITEWLPISSSGHLAIVQELFGIEAPLVLDVLLHFATLLVIFAVFWKDIIKIAKSCVKLDFKSEYGKTALFIVIATIPVILAGYFLHDPIESLFSKLYIVGIALIITGILLFASKKRKRNKKLNYKNTFLVGIVQAISLIPGISRSGSTISTALLLGIQREKAARFSFLLAIPAILGATIFELSQGINIAETSLSVIFAGMLASFFVGYISLKLLLRLIKQRKFHVFAYYCWVLGAIVLIGSVI